jgi:hypothetical protein
VNKVRRSVFNVVVGSLLSLLGLALPVLAEEAQSGTTAEAAGRAVALQFEAEVSAIDLQTREVSLKTQDGLLMTVTAPEAVIKLEEVSVGDRLLGTYVAALESELRAPTEAELAEPWVEVQGEAVSRDGDTPGVDAARMVRAVVTIEAMDPDTGVVVLKDSRGKSHTVGAVEAEKMKNVSVGQKLVVVFTQAMALTLEKKPTAGH